MTLVANLQSFYPGASGTPISNLTPLFRGAMDSVLLGMGRNVTLHLKPSKAPCPDISRFNSSYGKHMGPNGQPCRTCGGDGFVFEPRQTIYLANIRWVTDPLDQTQNTGQATIGGRIYTADVVTKMVIQAHNHLLECIGAEIDGIPVKLTTDPVVRGFGGELFYVICFWEKINKKTER